MTEAEWLACTDPQRMLVFLRGRASLRKLRLFAAACCRRAPQVISADRRFVTALGAVERHADGSAGGDEVAAAFEFVVPSLAELRASQAVIAAVPPAWEAVASMLQGTVASIALLAQEIAYRIRDCANDRQAVLRAPPGEEIRAARAAWASAESAMSRECAAQTALMRDIFGNTFRQVSLAPSVLSWHDATVFRLAQAAYDERHLPEGTLDDGRMAVLADALEEAGCSDADTEILSHCRSGGEHVRGCWVVDLILGKS